MRHLTVAQNLSQMHLCVRIAAVPRLPQKVAKIQNDGFKIKISALYSESVTKLFVESSIRDKNVKLVEA